jgi:TolA-binding protein
MRPSSFVLFLAFLGGCPKDGISSEYSRQVSSAAMRVAQVEEDVSEAEDRLDQLESVIREQGLNTASRLENIDQVNAEVVRLRGTLEVVQFQLDELLQEMESYQLTQESRQLHDEARLRQLEQFLGVQPPPKVSLVDMGLGETEEPEMVDGVEVAPEPEMEIEDVPEDAAGKLELAIFHMREGRQGIARIILERALVEHPRDAETAEIQYRLGETWFNDEMWREAALAFSQVNKRWPESEWAPWAVLRQGEGFRNMGKPDGAKMFYEHVIQDYKDSDAADEARRRLEMP